MVGYGPPAAALEGEVRRRGTASSKTVKAGRRKTTKVKPTSVPMAARRSHSSVVDLQEKLRRQARELDEAQEERAATSEVLKIISSSPGELEPVFHTVLENAVKLCDAKFGILFLFDGTCFRVGANFNVPAPLADYQKKVGAFVPPPGLPLARLVETKKVAHMLDDPEGLSPATKLGGARAHIAVPMLRDGKIAGAIYIYRQEVKPFADNHIESVENFAKQAVIAIENTRLLNELRESLQQQTATADVLRVISNSPTNIQPVLDAIVQTAGELCASEYAVFFRLQDGKYHVAASNNAAAEYVKYLTEHPISVDRGSLVGRTALERRSVHIADCLADPEYTLHEYARVGKHRSMLGVPLLRDGAPIGVICLLRTSVRPYTEKQIELVTTFADQAVIAIENVRLFEAEQHRTRELTESLEQQTATSEVLKVISSSPGELEPVFQAMLENAVRICEAKFGMLYRYDGTFFHAVALFGVPPAYADYLRHEPIRPSLKNGLGRVLQAKQPIHILDITAEQGYSEREPLRVATAELAGARTLVAVPMLKEDGFVGAIVIFRQEVRPFSDKQIELVTNFAAQAVIAVENTRLLNELRQRTDELGRSVHELRALGEVSQAVNSTLDLENVLSTIVAKAVQLSGTDAGAIYVFDDRQREFHLRATYGMDQELIDALTQQHIGLHDPNIELALAQGEPIQVADLREAAPSAVNDVILRAGFRALLVAPLLRGEDVVGMLVVRRKTSGAFPQNTVDLIKTFAAQSVLAIQNARLFNNVEARTGELAKSLEDLRTAQDRLVQTEKLASLGQLTAGIAHEIKNPLNFVNNFSTVSVELIDELREALGGIHLDGKQRAEISDIADTLQGNLDKVVQHGKRADAIVKNMLLHSRQGSGEHRPVDINALVEESLNLAYHGARAEKQGFNITLERSFDQAAGEVDLFPQEITRALLNLISNGFYAATKRKAQSSKGDYEPMLAAKTKNLGDSVEIRIRDNGTGIPPEAQEKLFNPFFTTKPAGEGTGLGLSISHDIIVKQHGGSIEVDTKHGDFTEFRIVLPRAGASLIKSGERTSH